MYTATNKDDTLANIKSSAQTFQNAANGAVSGTIENVKDDLRDAANNTSHKVRNFIHAANDEFHHATDTVTTQIRSNPMQSSAIALGVGFVLGVLLRR